MTTQEANEGSFLPASPLPLEASDSAVDLNQSDMAVAQSDPASNSKAVKKTKAKGAAARKKAKGTGQKRPRKRADSEDIVMTSVTAHAYDPDADSGQEDDRLYCVCQTKYDPEKMMIACDKCDEWYHTECLDMQPDEIELINDFICPKCQHATGKRTTWKARCTRQGCRKAQVALSKYCSDYCGMEAAATRLEESGIQPERLWPAVKDAQKRKGLLLLQDPSKANQPVDFRLPLFSSHTPPSQAKKRTLDRDLKQDITDENDPISPVPAIPKTDEQAERAAVDLKINLLQEALSTVAQQVSAIETHITMLDSRLSYLQFAVRRWETIVAKHEATRSAALAGKDTPTSRLPKKTDKAPSDAPCGFDVRCAWDDQSWLEWASSDDGKLVLQGQDTEREEEMGIVCTITRKRCDRHQGWQRLNEASFEAEKTVQKRKVLKLEEKASVFRKQLEELQAAQAWLSGKCMAPRAKPPLEKLGVSGSICFIAEAPNHPPFECVRMTETEQEPLPVIGSSEAQAADAKKQDEHYQIRIDLPYPPTALLKQKPASEDKGDLAIVITCVASETLHDLKSLVLDMDGYWLGAFQFVKVAPDGIDDQPASEILNEWSDVGTVFAEPVYQDPSVVRVLKVVQVPYNESEARNHILRARDLFTNSPGNVNARQFFFQPPYDPSALAIDGGTSFYTFMRNSVARKTEAQVNGKTDPEESETKETGNPRRKSKKSQNKPQGNGHTEKATNGHVEQALPSTSEHAFADWLPKDLPANPTLPFIEKQQQIASTPPVPQCVKYFGLSPWNPPPQNWRMRGHLLYITLTTLEGDYLHITSSISGFFIDKSDNAHFDPTPRAGKATTERVYPCLFALLADVSPRFTVAYRQLTDPSGSHPGNFSSCPIANCPPASPWLATPPTPIADPFRSQLPYLQTGAHTVDNLPSSRDWNEELLMIRELPRTTIQERLYRERLLSKTHADLAQAAARAVVGIVHGDILPANPHEPPALHTVVHQHLLLIPACDATDNFAHQGGEEAVRHSVGKDVLGARVLSNLDVPGLNLTPTVVVDYLGQRWVAQPILPGILGGPKPDPEVEEEKAEEEAIEGEAKPAAVKAKSDNSDEPELLPGFRVVYGGTDTDHPEKAYQADPDFERLVKKIANHLLLAKHDVYDVEGNPTSLWLSGDVKGVLGQDGNKYLIDLYRLQPMDVVFKETDLDGGELYHNPDINKSDLPTYDSGDVRYPHRFVLLRPELLEAYKDAELRSWIFQQVTENNQKKETEAKARLDAAEKISGCEEDDATKRAGLEDFVDSLQQPQTIININDFEIAFNPDAYVDRKDPAGGKPDNEDEPSTKAVRGASNYLRKTVINNFLIDCVNNGTTPADGFALSKFLHTRGINIRYLGLIASRAAAHLLEVPDKLLDFTKHALLILLASLEREMVVRGAKHVLRGFLHGREFAEVAPCVSHFLNCLVGVDFNSRPSPDTSTLPPSTRERPWTTLTPESLRQAILLEIARRYRYNLDPSFFDRFGKPQVLREVCLRSGIQLLARAYQFERPSSSDSEGQPAQAKRTKKSSKTTPQRERLTTFEPEDVAHIAPVIKDIQHKSTLADELFEQGSQQISSGNLAVGEGLVSDAINYYEQIFGSVHPELANRYHELAVSYHQLSQPLIRNINAYESYKEATNPEAKEKAKAETTIDSDEMLEQAKKELHNFVESAVQMNRQSVIVAERTLGLDHHTTAQQYVDLAILEHANGDLMLGLKLCRHAIELFQQIYGPYHSEAIRAITNAAQMMVQWQGHAKGAPLFEAAVDMSMALRGPMAVTTGLALSQLANSLALAGDLKRSQEIAKQTAELFTARLGKTDEKTQEAENLYEVLTTAIANKERGEQAKLGRLARRLGLNEERAKQLLERTNQKSRQQPEIPAVDAAKEAETAAQKAISGMPLQELVQFIQGSSNAKGKKAERRSS